MNYTIDVTQIAIQVIALAGTIAAPVLTVLGVKIAARLDAKYHLQMTAQQRNLIAETVDNGIDWLETQGDQVARERGKIKVTDENVAKVMNGYVIPHAMQTLAKSKMPAAHLGELIAARMSAKVS